MVDHGMFGTAGENLYSSIFKHCYVSLSCFMMNKSVRYQEKKWHLPITGRVLLLSSFFFFYTAQSHYDLFSCVLQIDEN